MRKGLLALAPIVAMILLLIGVSVIATIFIHKRRKNANSK